MRARLLATALAALCSSAASAQEPAPAPAAAPATAAPVVAAIEWHGADAVDPADLQRRIFTRARPFWQVGAVARRSTRQRRSTRTCSRITDTTGEHGHYRATAANTLR
jgi:hypothetical protein